MFRERLRALIAGIRTLIAGLRTLIGVPDLVLATISGVMTLAWVVGVVSPLSMASALAAGGLPASGAIGYVLFYQPPTEVTRS